MRALASQDTLTLRIFAVSVGVNVSVTGASVEDIGVIRAPARTWSPDAGETNSAAQRARWHGDPPTHETHAKVVAKETGRICLEIASQALSNSRGNLGPYLILIELAFFL
jgi:hypothetical protein